MQLTRAHDTDTLVCIMDVKVRLAGVADGSKIKSQP